MYIISKCLLGYDCKYNSGNNLCPSVVEFTKNYAYTAVCPETAGGLLAPRPPSELIATKEGSICVMSRDGLDVTAAFARGAEISLNQAVSAALSSGELIEGAILKARSPSCGYGRIYDGTFSGRTTDGNGVFARLLERASHEDTENFASTFRIITEEEL